MKTKEVIVSAYGDNMTGDAFVDISIQCLACNNLNNDMITCKAFKKGIPIKILIGKFDHTLPFKEDKGIRFERIK